MSDVVNTAAAPNTPPAKAYYSSRLTGDLLVEYELALEVDGLDNEIALLRALIKVVLLSNPVIDLCMRAFACLERLCKTNRKVFKRDKDNMSKYRETMDQLFRDNVIPPGFINEG